eukprot:NODE_171_length_16024_cov_0.172559.p6 type:complete len:323 gc:universal NODE_171_length_16024_cov_0.172559:10508-11476(+)
MSNGIDTDLLTLTRCVVNNQKLHNQAKGDLTLLLMSVQLACKMIASTVRKAGIINMTGLAGNQNVQGEDQKKLDVLSNDFFINALQSCGKVKLMISEENEDPIISKYDAPYAVCFDPLDGSSNIDAGVNVGSIFSIFKIKDQKDPIKSVLTTGREVVAAGYCMYGMSTEMVIWTGDDVVQGFTLDPTIGEFLLTRPSIQIPARGKIYSVNEGNFNSWHPYCKTYFTSVKQAVAAVKGEGCTSDKTYSLRYVGSMVADVHRTLLYGGIFAYPKDLKSKGKLRILYEVFPMSILIEKAGGLSYNEGDRVVHINLGSGYGTSRHT